MRYSKTLSLFYFHKKDEYAFFNLSKKEQINELKS